MSFNTRLLISSTPTSQIRWVEMPSHIANCPAQLFWTRGVVNTKQARK